MNGQVKHIVVIQSLINERPTGLELYEDIIKRPIDLKGLNFTHNYHDVVSKQEMIDLLKQYGDLANAYMDGIVFHLEMHGDSALQGLVLSNGDLITWKELVDLFRVINIGCKNNLYITMGTCNGRYMYTAVDPHEKSPYAAYISASSTVTNLKVAEDFTRLFENLLDNENLITSYLAMEQSGTDFYYKDSKTTFQEGFKATMDRLYGDENLKTQIVSDAKKQATEVSGIEVGEELGNMVFEQALRDIYKKHLAAFEFKD